MDELATLVKRLLGRIYSIFMNECTKSDIDQIYSQFMNECKKNNTDQIYPKAADQCTDKEDVAVIMEKFEPMLYKNSRVYGETRALIIMFGDTSNECSELIISSSKPMYIYDPLDL